jgi:hypothetical protein
MTSTSTSLQTAADAYIATAEDDPMKARLFEAVEEWIAASYEADGYSAVDLKKMDFKSAAQDYIRTRRPA